MIHRILSWFFKPAPPLTLRDIDPELARLIEARDAAKGKIDTRAVHRINAKIKRRVTMHLSARA